MTARPAYDFTSASIPVAAEKVGFSETTIKVAINNNDLVVHYFGTKPVIRAADLDEWIASLPTERPPR